MNKTLTGIIIAIFVLGALAWVARPNEKSATASPPTQSSGILSAGTTNSYDFGTISMAAGKVKHEFKIKNTSDAPITINKMYTSCMCTTASLIALGKQFGPYGMPGHGSIPTINEAIDPNDEIIVEAVFDPAAHGPAGVGKIQRTITIENSAGDPVELQFSAMVTP